MKDGWPWWAMEGNDMTTARTTVVIAMTGDAGELEDVIGELNSVLRCHDDSVTSTIGEATEQHTIELTWIALHGPHHPRVP